MLHVAALCPPVPRHEPSKVACFRGAARQPGEGAGAAGTEEVAAQMTTVELAGGASAGASASAGAGILHIEGRGSTVSDAPFVV